MAHTMDAVILGCGPAGLVAAAQLSRYTRNFVLVESGGPMAHRRRSVPAQMAEGAGGAGLFSDGKFSGGAAASGLKTLQNHAQLAAACAYVDAKLRAHGVQLPALMSLEPATAVSHGWAYKPYPSQYMSLPNRQRLIAAILHEVRGSVWFDSEVGGCDHDGSDVVIKVHRRRREGRRQTVRLRSRSLILAGGRFGPLSYDFVPRCFRRLEVGVRLIDWADAPLWKALQGVDPKYRYTSAETMEWRTFCCCRRGEVVATEVRGRITLSGRADGVPTAESNIGFNWRALDAKLAKEVSPVLTYGHHIPVSVALAPLLQGAASPAAVSLQRVLGAATPYVVQGLKLFAERFTELTNSSTVRVAGPTLEGVGDYPDVEDTLRLRNGQPIWAAGDCSGRFRGIVAAMLTGYYVAEEVALHLRTAVRGGQMAAQAAVTLAMRPELRGENG